jgi:hypothetical protein
MTQPKSFKVPFVGENMRFFDLHGFREGEPVPRWDRETKTHVETPFTLRDPEPFVATLYLERIEATRAAATAWFRLVTRADGLLGGEYPMMLRYLIQTIQARNIDHGYVAGWWTYAKHGANYSIVPTHRPEGVPTSEPTVHLNVPIRIDATDHDTGGKK